MNFVNSIPPEANPFVLIFVLIAVCLVAAVVRIFLLKGVRRRLKKGITQLDAQITDQQGQILELRSTCSGVRDSLMKQFGDFRMQADGQLRGAERAVSDQMKRLAAAPAPATTPKVVIRASSFTPPPPPPSSFILPEIKEGEATVAAAAVAPPVPSAPTPLPLPALPAVDERVNELEAKLQEASQQNDSLQKALIASRQRSKVKSRASTSRMRGRNNVIPRS